MKQIDSKLWEVELPISDEANDFIERNHLNGGALNLSNGCLTQFFYKD